ncbi:hypothetical protein CR513_23796, partial [Mucuna pruriens]
MDDLLTKLASLYRTIIQEALGRSTIEEMWLYRRGFSCPLLQCLGEAKVERAIKEVHGGACGSHIRGRALASDIAHEGFHWPIIKKDSLAFGVDILGQFPLAVGQVKFMVVDYFTKWIEVELAKKVRHFYWRKIIYCFGLLAVIVSDNGNQFELQEVMEFCAQYRIK